MDLLKASKFLVLTLWLSSLLSTQAHAVEGFEYHGYMRVGTGLSKNQTQGACYNLKNAGGNAFRYGNECSFYMENIFEYTYPKIDEDSTIWFKSSLDVALISDLLQNMESTKNDDLEIGVRQAFVEAGNVLTEGSALWVGKRFYKRRDIYLLDLFLSEASGVGGGVYQIDAGSGKFHFAFMQYRSQSKFTVGTESAVAPLLSTVDLRYDHLISGGNLETILMLGQKSSKPGDGVTDIEYEKIRGWELGFIYTLNFDPTLQSRTYLQLGRGIFGASLLYGNLLNGFESDGSTVVKSTNSATEKKQIEDSSTLRAAQDLLYSQEKWDAAFAWVYQVEDFGGVMIPSGKAKPRRVMIASVEPGLYISQTKTWKLIFNSGYLAVDNNWRLGNTHQVDTNLYKNTLAIQVARGDNPFIRPVFRLYVSDARWSNDTKAYLDNITGTFASGNKGLTVGVQAESWW